MALYLWAIYIVIAIVSFLPIVRMDLFSVSKKYTYFKYLSIFLFIWTLITGLRFVISNSAVLYYLLLTVYPLLFILTSLAFLAMMKYLGKPVSKIIIYFLIIFLIIELAITYTNNLHGLMIEIPNSYHLTNEQFNALESGLFFYIHTFVCYMLLLISMGLISYRLFKAMVNENDAFPFIVTIVSIIVGITLNFIHVFFYQFTLDPTYLVFLLFTAVLYFVFYIRDIRLIFKMNNNEFILDNLREMYIIVNQSGVVVDASKTLINKFSIKLSNDVRFADLKAKLSEKAIIYKEGKELEKKYDPNRIYLHMHEKPINLPFLKYSGHFYLFYDETKIQKYINEINYVMNHDLMTDLYNRNYFEELREDLEGSNDYGFIMFDLDGLKLFNDYLGHKAGDHLLTRFANKLKELTKEVDVVAIRMGGDEFLLVIYEASPKKTKTIIEKLKDNTRYEDYLKSIGFSYGCALASNSKTTAMTLSEADEKMYKMKTEREEAKKTLEEQLKKMKNKQKKAI
ncbi:MAG: diguanylate cyclase [Candidatus Izimaplasma sp.]|nr:diguanylate cyclase [Candidatus Izimaplasma bacterium]